MSHVITDLLHWFTGGENQYMRLAGCMKHDWFWIGLTVSLDLAVGLGYGLIAMHWWKNQKNLPDTSAKRALGSMRNIFLFCGICGYAFIPIKMIWPAWRLYDIFMGFLVYYTWKYAWGARDLKVIYGELGQTDQLRADLERTREESRRTTFFLNALSHDLRTPLNGLILQADVAEVSAESNDPAALKQALAQIRSTTVSTSQLLDRLLEYARLEMAAEPHQVTQFPLSALLQEIASMHSAVAEAKQIYLKIPATDGLLVRTDRIKLGRILTNLVDNAIKFTRTGGVRVEVEHCSTTKGVEIHVIDSGVGIDRAHHQRLFDEFFQVHNHERDRSKGFGMGLASARRLSRQLGGDIQVESAPGSGSRFTVVLPNVLVSANGQLHAGNGVPSADRSGEPRESAVVAVVN
jgi:signal transduction histidine kinase